MDQKQQLTDRIKQANNILVTVSNNPSVDQLASCIGLTLVLNKLGKHATAVFSGEIPSAIEFLQPEKTIEANTDSLRDFIISLDKSKADKLRYKVEDKLVKIFITPYRSSISEKDLEFSQGDFNVDVVVALGVQNQAELDRAITAHGRILHDATVTTINIKPGGELGSINWLGQNASSLSEMAAELASSLDRQLLDSQIATAFLTGIVAETSRFSNKKTTPVTMSISAELMSAGADQQLVATKLEEPKPAPPAAPAQLPNPPVAQPAPPVAQPKPAPPANEGTLEIIHDRPKAPSATLDDLSTENTEEGEETDEIEMPRIHIDDQGSLRKVEELEKAAQTQTQTQPQAQNKEVDEQVAGDKDKEAKGSTDPAKRMGGSRMILQPPSLGGAMNASDAPKVGFSDPLSLPQPTDNAPGATQSVLPGPEQPAGDAASPAAAQPAEVDAQPKAPQAADASAPSREPTLAELESMRSAVDEALASAPQQAARLEPIKALNAQPLGDPLHPPASQPAAAPTIVTPTNPNPGNPNPGNQPAGPQPLNSPPPVPPPLMPPQ